MIKIKCKDCGYERKVEIFLESVDNKCLNCSSTDLEVKQTRECEQINCEHFTDLQFDCSFCPRLKEPTGDNFPKLSSPDEFAEIIKINLPKINQNDINDLIIDLNIRRVL